MANYLGDYLRKLGLDSNIQLVDLEFRRRGGFQSLSVSVVFRLGHPTSGIAWVPPGWKFASSGKPQSKLSGRTP